MSWSNFRPSLVQPENTESMKFPPESFSVICHRPTIGSRKAGRNWSAEALEAPNPIVTSATTAAAKVPRDSNAASSKFGSSHSLPDFGRASLRLSKT